jgi:hypothetical protein
MLLITEASGDLFVGAVSISVPPRWACANAMATETGKIDTIRATPTRSSIGLTADDDHGKQHAAQAK